MGTWIFTHTGFAFDTASTEEGYQAYVNNLRPGLASLYALTVLFAQAAFLGLRLDGSPTLKDLLASSPLINTTTYPLLFLLVFSRLCPHFYAAHWQMTNAMVHAITIPMLKNDRILLMMLQGSSVPSQQPESRTTRSFRLFRKFLAENPTLATACPRALLLPFSLPMEIALGVAAVAVQVSDNKKICALPFWGPDRAILTEPYASAARHMSVLLQTTWGLAGERYWEQNPEGLEQDLPCHATFALWQVVAVGVCCGVAAARDRCTRRAFILGKAADSGEDGLPEAARFPAGWKYVIAEWIGGVLYTCMVPCLLWDGLVLLKYV
jgi:hypothetical protein